MIPDMFFYVDQGFGCTYNKFVLEEALFGLGSYLIKKYLVKIMIIIFYLFLQLWRISRGEYFKIKH